MSTFDGDGARNTCRSPGRIEQHHHPEPFIVDSINEQLWGGSNYMYTDVKQGSGPGFFSKATCSAVIRPSEHDVFQHLHHGQCSTYGRALIKVQFQGTYGI